MDFAALFDQLRAHPIVRRLAWLLFLSLVSALTLTGYLFGLQAGFFGRWMSTTLVLWLLAAGTTYGVAPATRWLTGPLVDKVQATRNRRPPKAAPPRRANAPTARPTSRPAANKWR